MLRSLIIALASTLLVTPVLAGVVETQGAFSNTAQEEEPKIDANKVRFGVLTEVDLTKDKVAVVNSKKVYLEIPAYKTIVKEKVEKGSARYIKLMEEATEAFRMALAKVAKEKSIKLIVETGGVSGVKTSDVTDAIIEAI